VFVPADSARDIVAFLLEANGIPAGRKELSKNLAELADIRIPAPPAR
jgi:hypothetical protein